ncbi:MAG: AAA family ATPase [Gammaproteobacteria bacterium]|nr:AAA family ATPase [Gammaproteobacteria bacterium]NNJ84658.1 AAA family ATPase [Gammaproteobacteria bacterium]
MFFKQIYIKNFRGIESLKIDNIKQINLLTGKNNCGKTSVLESIFLLAGMSNPQLAVNIHNFRGLALIDHKDFSYLFNGFDFSKNPSITGKSESQKRTLDIKPIYPTSISIPKQVSGKHKPAKNTPISSTNTTEDVLDGLAFDFNVGKKSFRAEAKLTQGNPTNLSGINTGQVNVKLAPDYREDFRASFTNPVTIMSGLHQRIEAVLVRKESEGIIDALREIEPKLLDISLGTGGTIYADITDIEKLIPINIMGDGIIKILAILVAILEGKNGLLLIDEIENGLHYSALIPLWKAIFRMALESNVQLFVATHSYECIAAMTEVYRTWDAEEDFITLFRIDRDIEGRHRALQYEADTLLAGIEKEFEVR